MFTVADEQPSMGGGMMTPVEPLAAPLMKSAEPKTSYGWKDSDVAFSGMDKADMSMQQDAATILEFIPFAKYALPTERAKFLLMDDGEKAAALAWDAFGASLMLGGGLILKSGGKAINKLQQFVKKRRLLKLKPVEDAVHSLRLEGGQWRGFDYQTEVAKKLKNMHFATDEAETIAETIVGGATDDLALKRLAWEKGDKLSGAWKKQIGRIGEKLGDDPEALLRKRLTIPIETQELLKPEPIRSSWARTLYKENLKKIKTKPNDHHVESIMKHHVATVYGDEAAKSLNLGQISEEEMSNLLNSMFVSKGRRAINMMHRLGNTEHTIPWMKPERYVYGAGESLYKTKSRIFDPLLEAQKAANGYRIDLGNTFMAMLQQRGFGNIVKEATGTWRFKPNKVLWNDRVLKGARDVLIQIDNLAEAGRRGKIITKTEARAEIQKLVQQLKADSPAVFELVDLTHSYTDVLYKDILQQFVPKQLFRLPLNQRGVAYLGETARLWGTRAEQLFSTASTANAEEKISFIKNLLADYRKLAKNPNFYDQLSKTQKKMVDEVLAGLKYGGTHHTAVPAYLEGYMPRVPMRGEGFAGFAKRALVGEAGAWKHRRQQSSGKLVESFQEMIEARTSAQAKQLYFYQEAGDIIEYAKTLPDAWRAHVDFTISRMIGQPSNWDHKLAIILSKLPGTGNWDEYRAMKAAKRITGMAYSGMLGLRPFTIFRNLTQPLLMTPPEMGGGIRDLASLIRGFGRALDPKHRKYIQKIGAITDFVPDQQLKPMLPKLGLGAHYDSMRDSFLYFFRQSDRFNRYWSGAAAIEKWEWASRTTKGGLKNIKTFVKKVGLRHRPEWEQVELRNLLKLKRYEEAKKLFVKGIIADTQYLYDTANAPSMMGSGGAQKLAMTFQSWWMNYGTAIGRWATTGQASDRVKRMGMAMITAAMTEQMLEYWAGKRTAIRSIGIGPFPLGDASMPPAFAPIWSLAGAVKETIQGYTFDDQTSRQAGLRHFKKVLSGATALAIPGGLMGQMAYKGYEEGEWPGLIMGIIQKKDQDFEPLFGLFD